MKFIEFYNNIKDIYDNFDEESKELYEVAIKVNNETKSVDSLSVEVDSNFNHFICVNA